MDDDATRVKALEEARDRRLLVLRDRAVEEAVPGLPEEPDARPNDVRGHEERDEGIEEEKARQLHEADADDDADRRPDVREEVVRVGPAGAMERRLFPARRRRTAVPPLIADATTEIPRPSPTFSIGRRCLRRSTAATAIATAAAMIISPSKPLERYSAFVCPKE